MEITGYKYNTESEAIIARQQCADFYGLPKSPEDETIYWIDYFKANLNTPIFWYIESYEGIIEILGEPETFNVVFEEPTP